MLKYEKIKKSPRQFLALTSLKVEEFDNLCDEFHSDWWKYYRYNTLRGKPRKYPITYESSDSPLPTTEDKLFFLLIMLKNNPLIEYQAASFNMSSGKVSEWFNVLSKTLRQTLNRLGLLPCREAGGVSEALKKLGAKKVTLDGTERTIQRSVDYGVQQDYYSGKKKDHTVKNNLLATDNQQIVYLSDTYEGKKHDKAICDEEVVSYPDGIVLRQDSGYIGHKPDNVTIIEPVKKTKSKDLTEEQKNTNKDKAKWRVIVEHAISGIKRCRMVKDTLRSIHFMIRDSIMEICCGLHNLRVKSYSRAYARVRV